ncbi:MAG: hypothetical protein ISS72_05840 [Candidatus Brocadiae bacterium]|nr:hypothetical protein [Candidatus Brocadiia bacterium]
MEADDRDPEQADSTEPELSEREMAQERRRRVALVRQHLFWRRKWLYLMPVLLGIGACLAVVYSPPLTLAFCEWQSESGAVIEMVSPWLSAGFLERDNPFPDAANVRSICVQLLGYQNVRDVLLSGKVTFDAGPVDPGDEERIERLVRDVKKHTSVALLGSRHVAVSHHGPDPQRNVAIVNELVKRFVAEARTQQAKEAREALDYFARQHETARGRLSTTERALLEFLREHPELPDEPATVARDYKEAKAAERQIHVQKRQVEVELTEYRMELVDEPEALSETVLAKPSRVLVQARRRVMTQLVKFTDVNEQRGPSHREWQAAAAGLGEAVTALQKLEGAEPDEVVVVEKVNPRIEQLRETIRQAEAKRHTLNVKLLLQAKRVAELSDLHSSCPGLLMEKRRLERERDRAEKVLESCRSQLFKAEKGMQLASLYPPFKVREYAFYTEEEKADAEGREEETEAVQDEASHYALGMAIGVLPMFLGLVLAGVCGPGVAKRLARPEPIGSPPRHTWVILAVAAVLLLTGTVVLLLALGVLGPG